MSQNFDPVKFLNLDYLPQPDQDRLRPEIIRRMAHYLICSVLSKLPAAQFNQLEAEISKYSSPDEVFNLIKSLDPDFENHKLDYLNSFKQEFNLKSYYDQKGLW